MSEPGVWRRLYPLSPIVRGGRGTIGIVILLVPALLRGGISAGDLVPLGVIALITLLGFVSWFVTRWTVDGDDLRIETGVLRRRSLRFPLSQVQAIDILRPGLGRLLGADARSRGGDEKQNGRHGHDRDTAEVSCDHADALLELNAGSMTDGYAGLARAVTGRRKKGVVLDGSGRFVYNRRFQPA